MNMAKISKDEVERLGRLARIKLSDSEIEKFQLELGAILEYVEKLQSVDTEGVEPTSQVTGLEDVWREDLEKPQPGRKELLKNSPDQQEGYVKVKRILQ